MDGMGSYLPAADQNTDTFLTDLSWEDWLSSGLIADPGFNMPQALPLPDDSASRCPNRDSNASSDRLTSQGWPGDYLEDPQFNFASCPQRTVPQDIESCILQPPQWSPIESLPSATTNEETRPANRKKSVSPTKRKHGSRIKPETPAKEPAKKEVRTKTVASSRTAHSVIEHNYRQNLSVKMEQLHQILSTADEAKHVDDEEGGKDGSYGVEDQTPSTTKIRKSDVLNHAYDYVKRSEREKKSMADENAFLKRRLVALEKLVNCEDCSLLKQMNMLQMGGGVVSNSECFVSACT